MACNRVVGSRGDTSRLVVDLPLCRQEALISGCTVPVPKLPVTRRIRSRGASASEFFGCMIMPMSDAWFAAIFAVVLLFFACVGIVLIVRPSAFLRHVRNPLQPDTPINRVNIRAVGVFVCLFILVTISGAFDAFHKNILVALTASPIILAVFLWGLWRYSSLQRVNRRYLTDETVRAALGTSDERRVLFAALHNCWVCPSLGDERHPSEMTHCTAKSW